MITEKWEDLIPLREKNSEEYVPSIQCIFSVTQKSLIMDNSLDLSFQEMRASFILQNKESRLLYLSNGKLVRLFLVKWFTETWLPNKSKLNILSILCIAKKSCKSRIEPLLSFIVRNSNWPNIHSSSLRSKRTRLNSVRAVSATILNPLGKEINLKMILRNHWRTIKKVCQANPGQNLSKQKDKKLTDPK